MIRIEQTRFSPQEGGNCYAACIASILEVPLDEVPQLDGAEGLTEEGFREYDQRVAQWLAARNLWVISLSADSDWRPQGYAILSAQSARFPEHEHAVVTMDGEIVWDPHPERASGVGAWRSWFIFQVLDPSWGVQVGRKGGLQ